MAATAAAVVTARRGKVGTAVAAVEEALEAIRESPEPQIRQPGLITAAEARLAAGEPAAARRHLDELVAGRFGGTFMGLHLPSAVSTAIATDATATANKLIDAASAFSPRLAAGADLSNGLLLEAEGNPSAAVELLRRAADAFRGLQMPYERARALGSVARCLTAVGRPTDAEPLASESAELLQQLGCAAPAPTSRPADSVGGV